MNYTNTDRKFLDELVLTSSSVHIKILQEMVNRDASYAELFAYGVKFLPKIIDESTRKVDLMKLNGYVPQIVEFFDTLSEMPSLPQKVKDLATDLAVYANGESIQTDKYYLLLNPELEIKKVLEENPRP